MDEAKTTGLVGKYFYIFSRGGTIDRQGAVRGDLGQGYFLVEFFDGGGGMVIAPISDMVGRCRFYDDKDEMQAMYEAFAAKRGRPDPEPQGSA